MTLISARSLSVRIDGSPILHDIDVEVARGEIVTVVGPNGSGKSTLLRVLIGAVVASGGTIERAPGLRIGYVPQRLHVDRSMPLSVRGFMGLPGRVPAREVTDALERAGALPLARHAMSGLSGGQLQRVLLARALVSAPDLLVLDEPTQGLDQRGSAAFYRQIESLRDELACAVLMVSHELHVVMSASDRVICLNGHICCQGTPDVVSSRPEYQALFGTGTQGALALYRHEHDHSHLPPAEDSARRH